jgi:DNA repair photolyase
MAEVIRAGRRSAVLTPSGLPCLSTIPTINLTAGCLHNCTYCYIRGYSTFPGEGRITLYEDTLERLREELARRRRRPRAVYFSPSCDPFQPAPEVLELAQAVLEFLFSEGIGVALLTKGRIPDNMMRLLVEHAELVRAQVGITTLDDAISQAFEPKAASPGRRLAQIEALVAAGVPTEARLDPILPGLTDGPRSVERLFAALARIGVRRVAASALFLRPAVVQSLRRNVPDEEMLARLLGTYQESERIAIRGTGSYVQTLPLAARRDLFARMREIASARGIELSVCACKNADLASGSCNIAGRWPRQQETPPVQALLAGEFVAGH